MNPTLAIGLSGMQAAAKRLAISADNVVNMQSKAVEPGAKGVAAGDGFQPLRAYQQSMPTGGTKVTALPVDPASYAVYLPQDATANSNGVVYRPNVSLEYEAVEQISAKRAYEASAKVIATVDEMTETLLDTLG